MQPDSSTILLNGLSGKLLKIMTRGRYNATPMQILKASSWLDFVGQHLLMRHVGFVALVFLLASFSLGQSPDRVEVFGGYSYISSDFTGSASGGVSGWNFSAAVRLFRYIGAVGDFSGFSPSGSNPCPSCGGGPFASYRTFMGGPQISARIGRLQPFARALFGATKGSFTRADQQFGGDFSPFTFAFGGGVDVGLNRWLAVRGQIDALHVGSQDFPAVAWVVFLRGSLPDSKVWRARNEKLSQNPRVRMFS